MTFVSKLVTTTVERGFQPVGKIGEKHSAVDVVFLAQFVEEDSRKSRTSRRKQPHVEIFVRGWIDGSEQPVPFGSELDHRLVDRDVIRGFTLLGL